MNAAGFRTGLRLGAWTLFFALVSTAFAEPPPGPPRVLEYAGAAGGRCVSLTPSGPVLYAGGEIPGETPSLDVFSLDDPASPRLTTRVPLGDEAAEIEPAGGALFIAARSAGLLIFDAANPAAPILLGSLDTSGDALAVAVRGTVAAVADGASGVLMISVADPSAPKELSRFRTRDTARGLVFDPESGTLVIADLLKGVAWMRWTDDAGFSPLGRIDTEGHAWSAAVRGRWVAAAEGHQGFSLIDASDPVQPRRTGGLDTPGFAYAVVLTGGRAYVASGEKGVSAVDVSDPEKPRLLGVHWAPGPAIGLAEREGFLYAACAEGGIAVYRVVRP